MQTIPSAASVVRKRYRMRKTLRFAALVLAMIFLVSALFSVTTSLRYMPSAEDALWNILNVSPFLIGAIALVAAQRVLVLWMIPMPGVGCPFCKHPAIPETGSQCTECGRQLPPELLPASTDEPPTPTA